MTVTTTHFDALMQTDLPLEGRRQGKVRDIYETQLDDGTDALVIVASDRISAFDVVLPNGVGGRGIVLTQISKFWFDMIADKLGDRIQHHLISIDPAQITELGDKHRAQLAGRVMIGHKTKVVPVECVVRGYLAGSGWKEYQQGQTVCGLELPPGLKECAKLPEPLFTPATKAEVGHDENIDFQRACDIAGIERMTRLRDLSIAIYEMAHDYAAQRGIILADTKFEFGQTETDQILLIDEVLTPDSSRFWPADQYEPGRDQVSFDKQYVRQYLQELTDRGRWDKTSPGPVLPDEVVRNTLAKYLDAYQALTGQNLVF